MTTGHTVLTSQSKVELFAASRVPVCRVALELSDSELECRLIVERKEGLEYAIADAPPSPRLTVTATVVHRREPDQPTLEQVKALLDERGVTHGIDVAAIVDALDRDGVTVIARGDPPIPGENARVDCYFSFAEFEAREFDERDRVDHFEHRELVSVDTGAVLARKVPASPGVPGLTVRGAAIPAPPVRDIPLMAGPGVELLADGLTAVAARP
ncbi:MAG: flagellar assembly protein A, partial [Methanocella sp.]